MREVIDIRPYKNEDEKQVIAMWKIIFDGDPPWNEPKEMINRKLTVQPELFFVAQIKNKIVGTVVAGFDGVRGWIHHLAVLESYRNQGIASKLMKAAEEGLAIMNCPKINLQVRKKNGKVIAFYESIGYEVEDVVNLGKRIIETK